MGLKWLVFVGLVVAAAAEFSEDDYDSYFEGWWSDEVPTADLGIVNSAIDKLVDNDNVDYPFYDTPDEIPDKHQSEENGADLEPLFSVLKDVEEAKSSEKDENILEENVVNDINSNDEIVRLQEAIDDLGHAIEFDIVLGDNDENISSNNDKEPEKVDDNFNDYQVEDNRSDAKDEELGRKDDTPNEDDIFKDYMDNHFGINDEDVIVNPPEFDPNVNQIVEDAIKLLEEENSPYEEEIEGTDLVSSEDKDEETDESELHISDNDDLKGGLDDTVDSLILPKDDQVESSNNDEGIHNDNKDSQAVFEKDSENFDDIATLFQKYENDMIDPDDTNENAERMNNSSELENKDNEENDNDNDDDTVDKVFKDLDADLDKLLATWSKLTADDSKTSLEETKEKNSMEEYEEKYDRPYKEGIILNQRDDFDTYDYEVDANVEDAHNKSELYVADNIDLNRYLSQEDDNTSNVDEEIENAPTNSRPDSTNVVEIIETQTVSPAIDSSSIKTLKVDDVTEEEYANLIYQFSIDHHDKIEINVQDDTVSPINMPLEPDDTIEITSPNYPNAYPANNVVDWIIKGEGTSGIELNITDLDLRGAQGDYLLINPGAARDGQGLLFSYRLPAEANLRQYRFTTADSLFIRFNAGAGLNSLPGFRLTVKPIWSASSDEDEVLPEPEALLPAPAATLTVNLGSLRYPYFMEIKETFLRIIADMATMYINANRIDPGMNTTLETTQITNIASCNINWPSFEDCVAVTFGVPLTYDVDSHDHEARLNQDDLITMWRTYVKLDPFVTRLRVLGITEFAVPNDNRMMMMWAVLCVGILIAAGVLGFALWRFSCFEGYSRMKEFSDTDSLGKSKRGLDLYPTPHQPLPPLSSDTDYKWADSKYDDTTRVDLGGFTNRSYARDELLIDSDDDNIAPRDRFTTDV